MPGGGCVADRFPQKKCADVSYSCARTGGKYTAPYSLLNRLTPVIFVTTGMRYTIYLTGMLLQYSIQVKKK